MTRLLVNGEYVDAVIPVDANGDIILPGDDVIDVTLAMEAAANHAGDVLSDTIAITNAVRVNGGTGLIGTIQVIDEDDQGWPLTLVFFRTNVSLGTKNAAPNISDANAREILGFVKVLAADYIDLGGVRVAFPAIKPIIVKAAADSRNVFVSAILDANGTYTASGLKLRIGMQQD